MRSPNRTHERETFCKYMSTSTAQAVLRHGTLRWSSPTLFNDPFDVPRELSFGISPEEIVRALARRMTALIVEPPEDTSDLEPKVRLIVETVKRGVSTELRAELLAGLDESAETHRPTGESMEALRQMWRSWLPDFRILCLTESPAHAAMWYHYADKYCGVVIELRCDDALDSAWLAARPVTYPPQKPAVYTADGWAELLTSSHGIALNRLLDTATYTKAPDWSYEHEWRITSFKRPSDTGPFTDYRFSPPELSTIYFGPNVSPEDRATISALSRHYTDVRLVNVSIGMNREFAFARADD